VYRTKDCCFPARGEKKEGRNVRPTKNESKTKKEQKKNKNLFAFLFEKQNFSRPIRSHNYIATEYDS
jgi:hypothetical protein|tara:strand:- start:342 stop:542 length:201 start_codon:yes stop_codon:yes gene_type:complete